MSTSIAVRFPWGRYHGTPWGRNVNEGVVDWPPEPWRIHRALYATWKHREPELDGDMVIGLLGKLADPPTFDVPAFSTSHTRHYMPDHKDGTDKVIDTFVVTERDAELVVTWPAVLDPSEREVLATLCRSLSYLGRAESVCEATLLDDSHRHTGIGGQSVAPVGTGGDADREMVRVLSVATPFDGTALEVRPSELRRAGRAEPPGSRRVAYPAIGPTDQQASPRRPIARSVHAVRFAIAAPSLPARTSAVVLGDVLRQAAMSLFGADGQQRSEVLSGKSPDGVRRDDQHAHAHYLAFPGDEATNGSELLDTLVVWAPAGFASDDVAALVRLDRLWGYQHLRAFRPCRLGVEAVGQIEHVAPELCGPASMWESLTPFAPARHGRRNTDWLLHVQREVQRELGYRGLPDAVVTPLDPSEASRPFTRGWLDFRRYRTREQISHARRATGLRLEFHEPVAGPIAIGALSHFGLGLFMPVLDSPPVR